MASKTFVCLVTFQADGRPWAWKMAMDGRSERSLLTQASSLHFPPDVEFGEALTLAKTATYFTEADARQWLRSFGEYQSGGVQP